ncbi:type II toxin-antitoxin system RelB/DinJ family antitoxin [Oribacterium sp. NK2B42]|uniref:type II toxin-antitoxin system RelB/DinJ family antitoxin n=1 Tax=Oribacterium sp. NK2B42 TaxID=689781 RepID=UPI00040DBC36|nr:type II toxin-antitoxin system RelB/DinJ family antitoxin [Oribacterium sp. NK2B42]MBO5598332.1 type II toxin-antitoxin system RelB/DinJ family antitoxin [Oribacterium sp.]MBO6307379.1 type II toxin-antitoxin system RelB/DinJ family antitoxin [Oribacterium sp.]MBP3803464.1 type II toxin-antitoxin system RelB/DinJ family antitoxin [Oribacterium sp.]
MAQATLSIRVDSEDKKKFENFCSETGMNVSVAVNMFMKKVIREQRIPFEITADPFYSDSNMERLRRNAEEMNRTGGTVHEVNLDE